MICVRTIPLRPIRRILLRHKANIRETPATPAGVSFIGKQVPVLSDCEAGESKGHLPPGGCHPLSGEHISLLVIVYAESDILRTEIDGK